MAMSSFFMYMTLSKSIHVYMCTHIYIYTYVGKPVYRKLFTLFLGPLEAARSGAAGWPILGRGPTTSKIGASIIRIGFP